eukprot:3584891-Prymnesium_polylepis.1
MLSPREPAGAAVTGVAKPRSIGCKSEEAAVRFVAEVQGTHVRAGEAKPDRCGAGIFSHAVTSPAIREASAAGFDSQLHAHDMGAAASWKFCAAACRQLAAGWKRAERPPARISSRGSGRHYH